MIRYKKRVVEALRKPHKIPYFLRKSVYVPTLGSSKRLAHLFDHSDISPIQINSYLDELRNDDQLTIVHRELARVKPRLVEPPMRCLGLYVLVRHYEPEVVVETGISDGLSSHYILTALERNESGDLFSIDLEETEAGPDGDVGWIVPDHLRDRWTVTLGDARDVLRPLLSEVGPVDLFFHDSLHTYEHMHFELETAALNATSNAVIACHDIQLNTAFSEFVDDHDVKEHSDRAYEPGEGRANSPFGYVILEG